MIELCAGAGPVGVEVADWVSNSLAAAQLPRSDK